MGDPKPIPEDCHQQHADRREELAAVYEGLAVWGSSAAQHAIDIAGAQLSIGNYQSAVDILHRAASPIGNNTYRERMRRAQVHSALSHFYGVADDLGKARGHSRGSTPNIADPISSQYEIETSYWAADAAVLKPSKPVPSSEEALTRMQAGIAFEAAIFAELRESVPECVRDEVDFRNRV